MIKEGTVMKKSIILLALSIAAVLSCAKEQNITEESRPQEPSSNLQELTFTALTDNNITKTTLADDFAILWSTSDHINVFSGTNFATNTEFAATSVSDNKHAATFSGLGEVSPAYYALFPYQSTATITNEGVITAELSSSQAATVGSFGPQANLSVAYFTGSGDLQFKNVGALLGVTITNAEVTGFKVEALDGGNLTGTAQISYNDGAPTVSVTDGKSFVESSVSGAGTYYVVVFPGTYASGFRLTLYKGYQYTSFSKTASVTLERNGNLDLGTMTGSKWKNALSAGEAVLVYGTAIDSPDVAGVQMRYSDAFYNNLVANAGDRLDENSTMNDPVGYDYEIFVKLATGQKFFFTTASGHKLGLNASGNGLVTVASEASVPYAGVTSGGLYRIRIKSDTGVAALRQVGEARYLQPNRGTNQVLNYLGNGIWRGYPVFGWTNPKGWGSNSICVFKFQIYFMDTWQYYGRYETTDSYLSTHIQPITDTYTTASWYNFLTVENNPALDKPEYRAEYGYCDVYLKLNAEGYTYEITNIRK